MGSELVKRRFPRHEFGTPAFWGVSHWIRICFLTIMMSSALKLKPVDDYFRRVWTKMIDRLSVFSHRG
jgi:hypothetical protein